MDVTILLRFIDVDNPRQQKIKNKKKKIDTKQ